MTRIKVLDRLFPRVPLLEPKRVRLAYVTAVTADALQLLLGPLGWAFADEIIDIVVMAVVSRLIGFHALLLPTFLLEFLPIADMLPTWTGCVALVVALRKRQQDAPPPAPPGDIIDI